MSITKLFRNRLMIGIVCIIAAGILCASIFGMTKADQEEVSIVRVASDLKAGAIIEDENLDTVMVAGGANFGSFAKDKSAVIGKYATTDLLTGEFLLSANVTDSLATDVDVLKEIPDGMVVISFESNDAHNTLSNKIIAGDIVSLITTFSDGQASGKAILPELTYVPVISVTTDTGAEQTGDQMAVKTVTTTVMVTPQQATIISAHNNNPIHMTLVSRGNEIKAEELLALQAKQLGGEKVIEGTTYASKSAGKSDAESEAEPKDTTKKVN